MGTNCLDLQMLALWHTESDLCKCLHICWRSLSNCIDECLPLLFFADDYSISVFMQFGFPHLLKIMSFLIKYSYRKCDFTLWTWFFRDFRWQIHRFKNFWIWYKITLYQFIKEQESNSIKNSKSSYVFDIIPRWILGWTVWFSPLQWKCCKLEFKSFLL